MQTLDILKPFVPYNALNRTSRECILQTMQHRCYKPGDFVESGIGPIDHVGFVIRGHAQAYTRTAKEKQVAVYSIGHGDFFGDLACLTDTHSIVSVVCWEKVEALVQSYEDFLGALENHAGIKCHVLMSAFEKLWHIYQAAGNMHRIVRGTGVQGMNLPGALEKAVRFIDNHYDQALTVAMVASVAGMSKSAFSRRFKQFLGVSFKTYLNHIRVSKAKHFIAAEGMNVTEACFAVGYNDTAYFSRTFRKIEGISPSQLKSHHGHSP